MALTSKFCFSCSVRLGSVIISIFTLVQAGFFLGFCISEMDTLARVSRNLEIWIETLDLKGTFLEKQTQNPQSVLTISCVFFSSLICSCILLLHGAWKCKTVLMYPFVILHLLYIFVLFLGLLSFLFFLKAKGQGLGDLILYSNLGGFALLFYLYTWACVVSLIQMINELKLRLKNKLRVVEKTKLARIPKK